MVVGQPGWSFERRPPYPSSMSECPPPKSNSKNNEKRESISDIWGQRGATYGEKGVCRRINLVVGVPPAVGEAVELRAVRVLEVRPVPVEQRLGEAQRLVGVLRVLLELGLEETFFPAFVNSILDMWQTWACEI